MKLWAFLLLDCGTVQISYLLTTSYAYTHYAVETAAHVTPEPELHHAMCVHIHFLNNSL